ncbi:glycosyltransferase family 17 protein [Hydnum rufescens UP504]|uniref:Glycosyltransferase family 17 protein n=1 Tax=Hydnum rufescens UP504 TaxID=1448309 RepID=A0A9P6BA00_9AGAM|nr:glycosyltransferase family 17 protein [Hydnum rufescens UP504]
MPEPLLPSHARYSGRSRFGGVHWTPRTVLLNGFIAGTLFLFIHVARRERWLRDLAYLTRPIWDTTEETPKNLIRHFEVKDALPGELCAIHGWKPLSTSEREKIRIFDSFLISIELDLLEIRLRELVDVVDYFLILEATRSFSGRLRDGMVFQDARAKGRFAFADAKIRYRLVDDFLPNPPSPFVNEGKMRRHMDALLGDIGVAPGDIVLMSDVDEIPSAHTVHLLKQCNDWPSPLHLNMRNYRYSFEFPLADAGYWRPKAVKWELGVTYDHTKSSENVLADAGWHCSWCFRYVKDIQFKMTVRVIYQA